MGLKRLLVPVVALLVVSGLVLGLVSGVFGSLAHQSLEAVGLETPGAAPNAGADPDPDPTGPRGTAAEPDLPPNRSGSPP